MTNASTKIGKFNLRIVCAGDTYGRDNCRTHNGAPLAEFYDSTYPHTEHGQFVSRYYVDTLLEHEGALCLDGGNAEDWTLSAAEFAAAKQVLQTVEGV